MKEYNSKLQVMNRLDPLEKWEGKTLWINGSASFAQVTGEWSEGLILNNDKFCWIGATSIGNKARVLDVSDMGIREITRLIKQMDSCKRWTTRHIKARLESLRNRLTTH